MNIKITARKNKGSPLQRKIDELRKLNKQKVEVGHFASQGEHGSGMSYVELMRLHNAKQDHTPARPILDVFGHNFTSFHDTLFNHQKKFWTSSKSPSNTFLLNGIGALLVAEEKKVFGVASADIPMNAPYTVMLKGENTPMVDTQELVKAVSYKTSIDGVVKTIGTNS